MFVPKHKLRNVVSFAGWISPLEKFPMFLNCWLSAADWLLPLLPPLLLLCVHFVCFAETRTQFARFAAYIFFLFALLLFLSLFLSRKCNFNLNKSKIKTKINCGQLHSGAGKLFRVRRMWICEHRVCDLCVCMCGKHTYTRFDEPEPIRRSDVCKCYAGNETIINFVCLRLCASSCCMFVCSQFLRLLHAGCQPHWSRHELSA